ncbi:19193_t:CDS:2 [Dentiscutata erythropus]|uniref:19193_t:CDS:1 n=1 Tax=Dentiscutata erythropus TaxID=1348616 RepID=A0A9N9D0R7_9GLOM|nr:19193_t:CDS:2 [Dentiscutata erythropus]
MRSIIHTGFLYIATILAFVTVAYAFSTGAGTCNADQATIEAVNSTPMGKEGNLGYSVTMSQDNHYYVPGGPGIQFTITGTNITTFKGILFYGADTSNNHVGQWTVSSGYKLMANCPGDPQGTLTHNSATNKPVNTTFSWTPPTSDAGPITVYCVICASSEQGFQIIQSSQPFTVNGSTFVPPASTNNTSDTSPSTAASKNSVTGTNSTSTPHPTAISNADSLRMSKSSFLIQLALFVPLIVSLLNKF